MWRIFFLLIFGVGVVFGGASTLLGFDAEVVHREINRNAGKQSGLGKYLKSELLINKGLDAIFDGNEVAILLENGGEAEDAIPRPINHFHDPLKPWESAGNAGSSALLWAQQDSNESSWNKARQNYYQCLTTGSPEAYAATFTNLGQLMHLVSDMAVPAHVRNDPHLEVLVSPYVKITHFEVYAKKEYGSLNYAGTSFNPGLDFFPQAKSSDIAPTPISALFDIDAYSGGNPEVTRGSAVGLAEYTNANFLSEGTIFADYPYPALTETTYEDVYVEPKVFIAEDNQEDMVKYVMRKDDPTFKIAAISYWANDSFEAEPVIYGDTLILDDEVFKDYAQRLVPRAVGYSSALLDYFFRGKLDVAAVPIIMDDTIWGISFFIKNMTPTEEALTEGAFIITYSPNGTLPDGSLDVTQTVTSTVSDAVPFEGSTDIDLWLDQPIHIADIETLHNATCSIAFKGILGHEPDAVVGKVFNLATVLHLNEEWHTLAGDYPWVHTTADDNPDNGTTSNVVIDGVLVKDNVRFADGDTDDESARYNSTSIDLMDTDNPSGILITPKTYIQYKVDDISIINKPEAPEGYTNDYQGLWLFFNNGLIIQLSYDSFVKWHENTAYWMFYPGYRMLDNIHGILQYYNLEIPDPLYLESINITQQLLNSSDSPLDAKQHMEVDFFRVIGGDIQVGVVE